MVLLRSCFSVIPAAVTPGLMHAQVQGAGHLGREKRVLKRKTHLYRSATL